MPEPKAANVPRIIGIAHVPRTYANVKKLIDDLPSGSKVALERIVPDVRSESFKKAFPNVASYFGKKMPLPDYFRDLARYAESKNHQVIWLDRAFFTVPERMASIRRLERRLRSNEVPNGRVRADEIQKMKRALAKPGLEELISARRRSEQFFRTIRRNQWKPTDLAIMGAAHALHVSAMLNQPVSEYYFEDRHVFPGELLSFKHALRLHGSVLAADLVAKFFQAKRWLIRKFTRRRPAI